MRKDSQFAAPAATTALGSPVVAVLAFHKVGTPWRGAATTWYYVSEQTLDGFFQILNELAWTVIDLPTFLEGLQGVAPVPQRSALITFDDGYRCVLTSALPVLRRWKLPAVVFVPASFVGGWNEFDRHAQPEEPICSWRDLRLLQDADISIQSHGLGHRRLSDLSDEDQELEVNVSKQILEAHLLEPVHAFAYPYGDTSEDPQMVTEMLRRAGYRAGFGYHGGAFELEGCNPFHLPRIAMGPNTDLYSLLKPVSAVEK